MSERELLDLPQHVNPGAGRTASAPYNFVPLPEVVVTAVDSADKLPHHDTFANADYPHSGYFEVGLTTRSPLYVRGMLLAKRKPDQAQSEFEQAEAEKMGQAAPHNDFHQAMKNKPQFFHKGHEDQPVIPGSSLRGMLRGLLEIASYGKVQWVSKKRLFFRTVDNTAVGMHYRSRMTYLQKNEDEEAKARVKVEGGFLRWQKGRYFIKKCGVRRILRTEIGELEDLYDYNPRRDSVNRDPMATPKWEQQYRACWVELDEDGALQNVYFEKGERDLPEARLIITGNMQDKRAEFVFLLPADDADEVEVDETLVERFHDNDQISQWQGNAFPVNKPDEGSRSRKGMLRKDQELSGEGDPVFFLREPTGNQDEAGQPIYQLTFFGRARMFRLPYLKRPIDLVPPDLRQAEDIDFAEAIFGYVKPKKKDDEDGVDALQGDPRRAYAGRVFVTDAVLQKKYEPRELWLTGKAQGGFTPKILATPKPTAFQQYLTQPSKESDRERLKKALSHYDSPTLVPGGQGMPPILSAATTIRGHKLYWHQGDRARDDLEDKEARRDSTQHTQLNPLNVNVEFKFVVHFENLSDEELGALCWTLQPLGEDAAKEYCHSLGMGKPLGMGAVKLSATLHLIQREQRYAGLFDGDDWQRGVKDDQGQALSDRAALVARVQPFEQCVLRELKLDQPHLYDVKRIAVLLKMLEWPGFKPAVDGAPFLSDAQRPNTRYMTIRSKEYKERPVLPDPEKFDAMLETKAMPQGTKLWPPEDADEPSEAIGTKEANMVVHHPASTTQIQRQEEPLPEVRAEVDPKAEDFMQFFKDNAGRRRRRL